MANIIVPINIKEFTDNVQRDDVEYVVSGDDLDKISTVTTSVSS